MPAFDEMGPDEIIETLGLAPHPEGGWFRETFRDEAGHGARAHGTAIYYLLKAGESSHWHRVDAAEIWHWYAGGPLALKLSADGQSAETRRLGPNLAKGERPQLVVPTGHWQAAEPLGAFTLVGCTVAPGFDFAGFEMAPKGWKPGK
jgi:predicted cupin superfamily sugar epimerase